MSKKEKQVPFGRDYWKEEGGDEWVKKIERAEPIIAPLSDRLLQVLNIAQGDAVLDVGCGGGLTAFELAKRVGSSGRVVGVDVSPQILAVAKSRGKDYSNVEFRECDAGTHELEQEMFDLLTSRFGVMFFENPISAFSNLRSSLKADGVFCVLVWRTMEENKWMSEPAAAIFEVIPPENKVDEKPDPDAPGPFSLGESERADYVLTQAGFKDIELLPVDMGMQLGALESALEFLSSMGPAAAAMEDATEEQKAMGVEAIRAVLEKYDTAQGVVMPGAAWIISAKP